MKNCTWPGCYVLVPESVTRCDYHQRAVPAGMPLGCAYYDSTRARTYRFLRRAAVLCFCVASFSLGWWQCLSWNTAVRDGDQAWEIAREALDARGADVCELRRGENGLWAYWSKEGHVVKVERVVSSDACASPPWLSSCSPPSSSSSLR